MSDKLHKTIYEVQNIGNKRICLFDDSLIDLEKTTATKTEHSPTKVGKCVEFDNAWEKEIGHPNILCDDGKYRLYYMAGVRLDYERIAKIDPDDVDALKKVVDQTIADGFNICISESTDGIHWTKPSFSEYDYKGIKPNNIILNKPVELFVMKDTNPNCKPEQKYKALYPLRYRLYSMFSADGIHFTQGGLVAEHGGQFDSLNTVYYDNNLHKYVAFVRGFHKPDQTDYPDFDDKQEMLEYMFPDCDSPEEYDKIRPRRDIRVMYSDDFVSWTRPERINMIGDDGLIQYYTNEIARYPRAPQYYIGFPVRYNETHQWSPTYDNLCGLEARKFRYKLEKRLALAFTDCTFISSRNLHDWKMSDGAFVRPGLERPDGWMYGGCYFSPGVFITKDNYGNEELSLYSGEGGWGFPASLVRYTLRLDGFVSYGAKKQSKVLVTKPFVFDGSTLKMNLSTAAFGEIKVTLTDSQGNSITSGTVFGDSTDKLIWFDGDLSKFAGKPVTMKIDMTEADVYSFVFEK